MKRCSMRLLTTSTNIFLQKQAQCEENTLMYPLHCLGLEAVNYEHHLPYFTENQLYAF